MKNPIKVIQTLIFTLCLIFGVAIGTSGPTYANMYDDCGECTFEPSIGLEFCNFATGGYDCIGNNGYGCGSGSMECMDPPPVVY